jgi:adrenodoxin-NADP+ reductase
MDQSLIPEDISKLPRPPRRLMEVLKKGAAASLSTAPKSWSLDFCLSPRTFNPNPEMPDQLGSVTFERNALKPSPLDKEAKPYPTGETVELPASLAFRSIGYKSEALQGFQELGIPFDDLQGIIPNDGKGRVVELLLGSSVAPKIGGLYCAGWVKRGPTGVIASTMNDAFQTAEAIAEDWYSPHQRFVGNTYKGEHTGLGWEGVKVAAEKQGCRRVSWEDWKKIDAVEKEKGKRNGKQREKFTRIDDMLAVLD